MLKNLLQRSRVFSLPETASKTEQIPTKQALRTTSANHYRRNWGLKYNMPRKAGSTLLTHHALDTDIGIPKVDYGSSNTRRVQKFAETGAPITLNRINEEIPSLFSPGYKPAKGIMGLSKSERRQVFHKAKAEREKYPSYVDSQVSNSPQKLTNSANALTFMGLSSSSVPTGSSIYNKQPSSAIGLSYNLKGAVYNTPEGIVSSYVIPARVLPFGSTGGIRQSSAAVAGFIGHMTQAPVGGNANDLVSHQTPVPMYVSSADATMNGSVSLKISPKNTKTR